MKIPATLDETLLAIAWYWNLFGLPVVLVAATVWRARGEHRSVARDLGWIFIGMACWSLIWLGQALWAARGMGFVAAHLVLDLLVPLISAMVNLPIGFGLLRLNRWARWVAIPWCALRAAFGIYTASLVRYGSTLDWTEWPRLFVEHALPAAVFLLLLLPGPPIEQSRFHQAIALLTRWLLVIVGSVVVLDALDFSARALFAS
jgi:hypothetical protein